MTSQSSS